MPTCGNCTSPCSCTLSEDGFFDGNIGEGRNFTQVEGSGSAEDPFVIHFLDQKEFRPKAAEISIFDIALINSTQYKAKDMALGGVAGDIIYQSPVSFLIVADATEVPTYAQANYFVLGASVTFAQTADATSNIRQIALTTRRGSPPVEYVLGSQITPGGSSDPLTLSCMGYTTGLFVSDPALSSVIQSFDLYVYQNSGGPILLTDMRIWMAQI